MPYVPVIIVALVAGYYLLSFLIALLEKDHLRGDLAPQAYQPEIWKSAYLDERSATAAKLGLIHCGDYHTTPHASVGKGPTLLYLNESRTAIIAFISARMAGVELKKTQIRTRWPDGRVLETNDSGGMVDVTGGTQRNVLWEAPLVDLLAAHEASLQAVSPGPEPTAPAQAFAQYELIDVERGQRMVDQKLARWTDPSHSTIRRTFKGARVILRANNAQTAAIVRREQQRREAAKREKK